MSITGRKRKLKETEENVEDDEQSANEDVSVKSHAALRKERKKASKQTSDVDNSEKERTKPQDDPPPARQNSVWVGNLAYKTTQESLKTFFDGVGEITRIHMPTKNVGQGGKKFNVQLRGDNMGFAYVDFTTSDAKTIAISLSESNLDGRKLLIKDGTDFTGRPSAPLQPDSKPATNTDASSTTPQSGNSKFAQKVLRMQKQPPAPTLFMGNLPFEIGVDDIRSMLETHRNSMSKQKTREASSEPRAWLKKIRLGTFQDSGKCKGWAFLDFVDTAEATAALINPRNCKMNGRDLVLEYASHDAVRRGGQLVGKDVERPRKKNRVENPRSNSPHQNNHDSEETLLPKEQGENEHAPQPVRRDRLGKDGKVRPRPGAALAMAKRENVAIVQSEGKKIIF